jgi:hypothetical protein
MWEIRRETVKCLTKECIERLKKNTRYLKHNRSFRI